MDAPPVLVQPVVDVVRIEAHEPADFRVWDASLDDEALEVTGGDPEPLAHLLFVDQTGQSGV